MRRRFRQALLLGMGLAVLLATNSLHANDCQQVLVVHDPAPKPLQDNRQATDDELLDFAVAHLSRRVTMRYCQASLDDVLADMQKAFGLRIEIDTQVLNDSGIGSDIPASVTTIKTTWLNALWQLARRIDPELTFTFQDDVLFLTTIDAAARTQVTESLNVADLVRGKNKEETEAFGISLLETIHRLQASYSCTDLDGPVDVHLEGTKLICTGQPESLVYVSNLVQSLQRMTSEQNLAGKMRIVAVSPWPAGRPAEAAIQKALATKVPLDLVDVPLEEALEQIGQTLGITILLDEAWFHDIGIDGHRTITLNDEGRTLSDTLGEALQTLDDSLVLIVLRETLYITNNSEVIEFRPTVIYSTIDMRLSKRQKEEIIDEVGKVIPPTGCIFGSPNPGFGTYFRTVFVAKIQPVGHKAIVDTLTKMRAEKNE